MPRRYALGAHASATCRAIWRTRSDSASRSADSP